MKKFKRGLAIALISLALTTAVGSTVSACDECIYVGDGWWMCKW